MEMQSSTSKVTVEYYDPHDVYKLLSPGLVPRLPLHNLHWQSHSGPLRSIGTLHVELVRGGDSIRTSASTSAPRHSDSTARDDGFQTQSVGGRAASSETTESSSSPAAFPPGQRRHQIPGLRHTPYLKVLFVRCDDNDSYKSFVRSEVREWIKVHTQPSSSSKKGTNQEKHDAFEWMIVHVVIPNTAAATQPRSSSSKLESGGADSKSSSSRWRSGSTPLLEKFRSDFNSSGKGSQDRVAQIRIGINDVPYDLLPRVVPAVPSGYNETEKDAENAWNELVGKIKDLILASFDKRVRQYEDDIKERDAQRTLPGWNFCTFFILKEGLARGFESVGLVEDALVGYDELSVGLDSVIQEPGETGSFEQQGGALPTFTDDLKKEIDKVVSGLSGTDDEEEAVDLQSEPTAKNLEDIPISSTKKAYRDLILANNVSVFDFRCYIFSRQVALLLRLGNASSSKEELLAKLKDQQEAVLHGVAPLAPAPRIQVEEGENLSRLAEICRRTLQFIPVISQIMRQDILAALAGPDGNTGPSPAIEDTIDNIVTSFSFSVAQQILAQTSTKTLSSFPSILQSSDVEQKVSIPEPKTMMHPARSSSLHTRPISRPPPSPGIFPGPGRPVSAPEEEPHETHSSRAGLEDLAARRAELYLLSRSLLDVLGKKRKWSNGWDSVSLLSDFGPGDMEVVDLDGDVSQSNEAHQSQTTPSNAGIGNQLLRTATDSAEEFYRLYQTLTDKAHGHFEVAGHDLSLHAALSDLAVLKYYLRDYEAAASLFRRTTPQYGKSGWSWLELSMLVMYSQCLRELQSKQDYVRVALKLLIKACAAEKEWFQQRSPLLARGQKEEFPDMSSISNVVDSLSDLAKSLPSEARVPLTDFFSDMGIIGYPQYPEGRDSSILTLRVRCLLPDGLTLDTISIRASNTGTSPCKDLWFTNNGTIELSRGMNIIKIECNSVVPGHYKVDQISFRLSNLHLHYDAGAARGQPSTDEVLKRAEFSLYQGRESLDVDLVATKNTALDKTNSLNLVLSTGWNTLTSCEIRVKPATGGLRLITTEATLEDSSRSFAKTPEAGSFFFGPLERDNHASVRFPYTVEQDVSPVTIRVEVTYTVEGGESFYFAKALQVPIALAVGVNVQDVFKHEALFSRFSVSTASDSPLRLFKSELLGSDLFESTSGNDVPLNTLIFPKQPVGLLYKIRGKPHQQDGTRPGRTMHLNLYYSSLRTEIEELFRQNLIKHLHASPVAKFERPIISAVIEKAREGLEPHDLERIALLGEISTSFLTSVNWKQLFSGLGRASETDTDLATEVASFMEEWRVNHGKLRFPSSPLVGQSSISIPVEIPSVSIVHTADIRLDSGLVDMSLGSIPSVSVNQMLSATLKLQWTKVWNTEPPRKEDQEFSYELTAPPDTWLLGGRRRGHFVIPRDSLSSAAETEAEIPLILIPQKEGWLPYPNVEIRELGPDGEALESQNQTCETDWKNMGETVRVVGGRSSVTVSLDASGSGGGPLVLEVETPARPGIRLIA